MQNQGGKWKSNSIICNHNFQIYHIFQENLEDIEIPLGFTFSFPMHQSSLCYGTLVRWTKGFENPDVVDRDVAELLNIALSRNTVSSEKK